MYSARVCTQEIQAALKRLPSLPARVDSWNVEAGGDATGEQSIWVWAILAENADRDQRSTIRDTVRDVVKKVLDDPDVWVYVRFRTRAELEPQ